jgi:hypothetical protein
MSEQDRRWAVELLTGSGGSLLEAILAAFLPLAKDLPASERHHHAWPFGLVEHSLEVALGTLARIADAARRSPLVAPFLGPALAVALLHDLGKIFDVDGANQSWRRGRGFLGHSDQTELILSLTPAEWSAPVRSIATRYDARFRRPRLPEEPPLDFLADAIAWADGQCAWHGRTQHPMRGRYLRRLISSFEVAA